MQLLRLTSTVPRVLGDAFTDDQVHSSQNNITVERLLIKLMNPKQAKFKGFFTCLFYEHRLMRLYLSRGTTSVFVASASSVRMDSSITDPTLTGMY